MASGIMVVEKTFSHDLKRQRASMVMCFYGWKPLLVSQHLAKLNDQRLQSATWLHVTTRSEDSVSTSCGSTDTMYLVCHVTLHCGRKYKTTQGKSTSCQVLWLRRISNKIFGKISTLKYLFLYELIWAYITYS